MKIKIIKYFKGLDIELKSNFKKAKYLVVSLKKGFLSYRK